MNLSLENKTAVVCGSSQGIGLAIAQELALLGAHCILLARNAEALQKAVDGLDTSHQQTHSFVVADFSDTASVQKAIDSIVAKGPVHILINNTGGPAPGPITDATPEQFVQAFYQHIINNQLLAKAVLPGMKAAQYGRIINIISTSVKIPLPNLGVSNTIRAATASWAKTLSNEVGSYNITVNNILPGFTETKRLESIIEQGIKSSKRTKENVMAEMVKDIPLRRFGKASEVAAAAAFLASPAASYITGVSLRVDGGRTGSI